MTTVPVWPRQGASVPVPNEDSPPLASSGTSLELPLSDYLKGLIRTGLLLTEDPTGDTEIPEVEYFTDAVYCESLAERAGDEGGQVIATIGYDTRSDGGGGVFYWDATSTTSADNGLIFGSLAQGRWRRIYNGEVHLKWFGAKGDGTTDDTAAWQAFLSAIPEQGRGYVARGTYLITSALYVTTAEITVIGEGSALTGNGAKLMWDGESTTEFAVNLNGYGQTFDGISIGVQGTTRALLGGYNLGSRLGSLNSRCSVKNCMISASSAVGQSTITIGVAVSYGNTTSGNQDFHRFENVQMLNCLEDAAHLSGSGNAINTIFERCTFSNYMGVGPSPGVDAQRMYVERGMSDNETHPYGRGINHVAGNSFVVRDCNFSYIETWIKITGDVCNYVTIDGVDSEHCKKAMYISQSNALANYSMRNTRAIADKADMRSLGPDGTDGEGYLDSDVQFIQVSGPGILLDTCNITLADNNIAKIDGCIFVSGSGGGLVALNCMLPSHEPFANGTNVTSWKNYGSRGLGVQGPAGKVLDGNYYVGDAERVPTHFDSTQRFAEVVMPATASGGVAYDQQTSRRNTRGTVNVADGNTTASVVFSVAGEVDANYVVRFSPISISGSPAAGAYNAIATSKLTTGFLCTVPTAPGVGNSVTFLWEITS